MLFNKKIDPCCAYCEHSTKINDSEIICIKKGVMPAYGSCRRFLYAPLKRVPEAPAVIPTDKFTAEDFEI